MIKSVSEKDIDLLKEKVEQKLGKKIVYSGDCIYLSELIEKEHKRRVSASTVKRFWGIISSNFNPSKYTLDSLSIFCNFTDFDDFRKKQSICCEKKHERLWKRIKQKATTISEYSYKAIKSKSGIKFENTIARTFAEERTEKFLLGNKTAMAFVAPDGYGKSVLMAHLANNFFLKNHAPAQSDILWFIDCSILDSLLTKNFNFDSLFLNLMGFDSKIGFRKLVQNNPEIKQGRVVLMIDGIDEIASNAEKTDAFIDSIIQLIATNDETEWFKIIIACTPFVWRIISDKIKHSAYLVNKWFETKIATTGESYTNVPLMAENEIQIVFKKNDFGITTQTIKYNSPQTYTIIRTPYLLQLFLFLSNNNAYVSEIELLHHYLKNKLLVTNTDHKIEIIRQFYTIFTDTFCQTDHLPKELFNDIVRGREIAYNELIISEFFIEFTDSPQNMLFGNKMIKFNQKLIYEFLYANYLIQRCEDPIKKIIGCIEKTENNIHFLTNTLAWLVRYLFKENKTLRIKEVIDLITGLPDTKKHQHLKLKILETIGCELRYHEKLRENVLIDISKNSVSCKYYFEEFCDLDSLILYFGDVVEEYPYWDKNIDGQIFGYSIRFLKHFIKNDKKGLVNVFNSIGEINFENTSHFVFNLVLNTHILFQFKVLGEIQNQLTDYIFKREKTFCEKREIYVDDFYLHHFTIPDAFNMCDEHLLTRNYIELLLHNYKFSTKAVQSRFYKYLILAYIRSLLHTGNITKGMELFFAEDWSNNKYYPVNSKYYWKIRFLFVETDIFYFDKKYCEAKRSLQKIIEISKVLKFEFFEQKATTYLHKLERVKYAGIFA